MGFLKTPKVVQSVPLKQIDTQATANNETPPDPMALEEARKRVEKEQRRIGRQKLRIPLGGVGRSGTGLSIQ
ncbi:MAG: hypothetical protein HQL54_04470 [Magnetococcales bacterium]|nr:hypothetical protein [Magnetococcales bacterium]